MGVSSGKIRKCKPGEHGEEQGVLQVSPTGGQQYRGTEAFIEPAGTDPDIEERVVPAKRFVPEKGLFIE